MVTRRQFIGLVATYGAALLAPSAQAQTSYESELQHGQPIRRRWRGWDEQLHEQVPHFYEVVLSDNHTTKVMIKNQCRIEFSQEKLTEYEMDMESMHSFFMSQEPDPQKIPSGLYLNVFENVLIDDGKGYRTTGTLVVMNKDGDEKADKAWYTPEEYSGRATKALEKVQNIIKRSIGSQ